MAKTSNKYPKNLEPDVIISLLPCKAVNSLISIWTFCVKKQKLPPLKLNQSKLNSRITNCLLRASEKTSYHSKAVAPLISISIFCLMKQQLQAIKIN